MFNVICEGHRKST